MIKKYQRLVSILEKKINTGIYKPGDFLPGERMLSDEFGFSRVTVRASLEVLTRKNLVYPVVGRGYSVAGEGRAHPKTGFVGGVFAGSFFTESPIGFVPNFLSKEGSRVLEKSDYNLIFSSSDDDLEREKSCLQRLLNRKIDGFLVMPALTGGSLHSHPQDKGNCDFFKTIYSVFNIPIVLMDRPLYDCELPAVLNDDEAGGDMQTTYFLEREFRRILYLNTSDSRVSYLRFQGYRNAMGRAGLPPEQIMIPNWLWHGDFGAYTQYLETFIPKIGNDAAFICGPHSVPALEKHFLERGTAFRVEWGTYDYPASLLGFPNIKPHMFMRRPLKQIAVLAAEKLLRLMEGDTSAATTEKLPPEIVPPESFQQGFKPSLLFHS